MKRDKPIIWTRRWTVWKLREQGCSLQWIADALDTSRATVCNDLNVIRDTPAEALDQYARRARSRVLNDHSA